MLNDKLRETHNAATNKKTTLYDVVIVGGGLIGKTLALALANTPLKIAIIEATPPDLMSSSAFDARSIAISLASKQILDTLHLWEALKSFAEPIRHIHVSQAGHFSATRLHASEHQFSAFGYVIELSALNKVFHDRMGSRFVEYSPARLIALQKKDDHTVLSIEKQGEQLLCHTKLLVAADGANSTVRRLLGMTVSNKSYQQSALVTNIGLNRSHRFTAYERFMGQALMALLPMTRERVALVWAQSKDKTKTCAELSDKAFLDCLQAQFGYRLGRFMSVGKRQTFPLNYSFMPKTVSERAVFLGNAAHGLHPIAGQGFNLGLRDAAILAEVLVKEGVNTPSSSLLHYESKRKVDQERITRMTDGFIRLFSSQLPGVSCLRDLGLGVMDSLYPLKNTFVHYAAGFSEQNARLAVGLPLETDHQKGC